MDIMTNECHLRQTAPGGTLHRRFCVAKEIKRAVHHCASRTCASAGRAAVLQSCSTGIIGVTRVSFVGEPRRMLPSI